MKGKLFLSGGGNEKQTYALDEVFLKVKKILYLPIAWKNDDFESCLKWFNNMISQHNKKIEVVMLTDLNKEVNLQDYDAIYIGGGNTFKLLKKIKDSRFDKKLIKYYNHGGIIYGGSAGAIILGNDIEIAKICKDADVNEVGLKNTKGLNLIKNYDIQCHFGDRQIEEHKRFLSKTKRNIICIPEESALLLENNKYYVIGLRPIVLITEKEIKRYKPNEVLDI